MNASTIPDLDTIRKWIDDYAKRVANLQDEKGKGVEPFSFEMPSMMGYYTIALEEHSLTQKKLN